MNFNGIARWLVLIMIVFQCINLILRNIYSFSSIFMQEVIVVSFSLYILLGAGLAFKRNAHIRLDIFYHKFSDKIKMVIDLIGDLFFALPLSVAILYFSYPFIKIAWMTQEKSSELGGLPGIYLVKSTIAIFAVLLCWQIILQIKRSVTKIFKK